MRPYATFSFMLLSLVSIGQGTNESSCDVIIRSDSTELFVKITEVLTTKIHYRDCNNDDNTIVTIATKDVIAYRYASESEFIEPWEHWKDTLSSRFELGFTCNFVPIYFYEPVKAIYGLEFHYKFNESEKRKHFATAHLQYNRSRTLESYYYNVDKEIIPTKYNTSYYFLSMGYRAELKNNSRWKFTYGMNADMITFNNHSTPYDTITQSYQASNANTYYWSVFGISPKIGTQFYFSQRCFLQIQASVSLGFLYYSSTWRLSWDLSVFPTQLPSVGLFVRL